VLHHDSDDQHTPYLSKFRVPSNRAASLDHAVEQRRSDLPTELARLDQYKAATLPLLTSSLAAHRLSRSRCGVNFSRSDAAFVQRLMTDESITIKPADKNLGLAMVSTEWYTAELRSMLADRVTYKPVRSDAAAMKKLKTGLLMELKELAVKHKPALHAWSPVHADAIHKYLNERVKTDASVPHIYLLIKVHKPKGLCGRPIVPSHSWLTTPASKLADHLLQEIWKKADIPHIVKDTKSLVVELEKLPLPSRDGVFMTADIGSLYTNIDTKMGLDLVRRFLTEQNVEPAHIVLIMALLAFVMNNSYLQFGHHVYLQVDGTAMGTSVAPTYANIVVYMLERDVIADMSKRGLYMYFRFLDDIFAYLVASLESELRDRLNALHPKLKFDFVTTASEAAFLDLCIHKGTRFSTSSIFDLRVHQKSMNLYLYIPYRSFHTEASQRSFIQTELMRYIRNCSSRDDYLQLRLTFHARLRDRGYPMAVLHSVFTGIRYADRPYFLHPASQLHLHPLLASRPPVSTCLLRRLARAVLGDAQRPSAPPVFVIPYSPLSTLVPTRALLLRNWHYLSDCITPAIPRPIIAYQSAPSLFAQLVFMKAAAHERRRAQAGQLPPSQQAPLTSYLTRPTGATPPRRTPSKLTSRVTRLGVSSSRRLGATGVAHL
jgi:hypothetical protein